MTEYDSTDISIILHIIDRLRYDLLQRNRLYIADRSTVLLVPLAYTIVRPVFSYLIAANFNLFNRVPSTES
jgi:hypothetical protein